MADSWYYDTCSTILAVAGLTVEDSMGAACRSGWPFTSLPSQWILELFDIDMKPRRHCDAKATAVLMRQEALVWPDESAEEL